MTQLSCSAIQRAIVQRTFFGGIQCSLLSRDEFLRVRNHLENGPSNGEQKRPCEVGSRVYYNIIFYIVICNVGICLIIYIHI